VNSAADALHRFNKYAAVQPFCISPRLKTLAITDQPLGPSSSVAVYRRKIMLRLRSLQALFCAFSIVVGVSHANAETPNEIFQQVRHINTSDAIDQQGLIEIGGIKQWVSVRGRHKDNPILLFLHGGPAFTVSPVSYYWMRDWEEYFTVVQWDQRSAGKTFAANDPESVRATLSIDRVVADGEELITYLRKNYGKQRIVLFGHSWGTIIGTKLAERHPDWLYVYVGMGQFVDFARSERLGYEATLAAARAAGNEQAVKDLEGIAPFPDATHPERNLQNLPIERRWLATFDGYYWHGGFGHSEQLSQFSPDYTQADLNARNQGMGVSNQALWEQIGHVNFTRLQKFSCPIIFMQGRHDLGTSASVLADWYPTIKAPVKKLVWFEDSAHMVYEEEAGKVLVTLVNEVLPLTRVVAR
jgi:proline iminopeptidase